MFQLSSWGFSHQCCPGSSKKKCVVWVLSSLKQREATRVPAGGALAVDREGFASRVTEKVSQHPLIEVIRDEITELPTDAITVVATGPLTSDALAEKIHALNGGDGFYFYDAAAPIIDVNTVDMNKVYLKSRYDKGEAAYLNCPMTKQEFMDFHEALVNAEEAPLNSFEKEKYFEGCMPIEVMAKRGIKTMLYGPMKPVGLEYPDDYKGPRDGSLRHPTQSFSCAKTMRLPASTISSASKLTLNGANKNGSSK